MQKFEFEVVAVGKHGKVTERKTHRAQQFTQDLGNDIVLEMVAVPGSTFLMGSPTSAVMKWTPPYRFTGAKRPVERVSWNDAQEFCRRLSDKTGCIYHLPSEAEWEYACRARTTTPFYCGETIATDLANYCGEHTYRFGPKGLYRHETTEVGSFPPNAFGLYDMLGNLWEWCADTWHENYLGVPTDGSAWQSRDASQRVVRGGSWHEPPDNCRCASRLKYEPPEPDDRVRFRAASAS